MEVPLFISNRIYFREMSNNKKYNFVIANTLGISVKKLSYILYSKPRSSYYHTFQIEKSNGSLRTIQAIHEPMRSLQRAVLEEIFSEKKWQPTQYAHGFCVTKSIITNAEMHKNKKIIIKVDLENFFPSINFGRILGMLKSYPFNLPHGIAVILTQIATTEDKSSGLPQGGVLSPYLSNMICRRLDIKLSRLARDNNCIYTRYADDITFSSNDINGLDRNALINAIYEIIADERFIPNEEKTRILTKRDRQIVTGIVVNDGVNINREYIKNLRAEIYASRPPKKKTSRKGLKHQIYRKRAPSRQCRTAFSFKKYIHKVNLKQAEKDLVGIYLNHLFGRIQFVGQVVNSTGQIDKPERYKRIGVYEKLIVDFCRMINESIKRHPYIKDFVVYKRLRKVITNNPKIERKLDIDNAISNRKLSVLDLHNSKVEVIKLKEKLHNILKTDELNEFLDYLCTYDRKFLKISPANDENFSKKKNLIMEYLSYPALSIKSTYQLLHELKFRPDDGLGMLTHTNEEFTGDKMNSMLRDDYYPNYYLIPEKLRLLFDKHISNLDKIFSYKGYRTKVSIFDEPSLVDSLRNLKKGTRFSLEGGDTSTLLTDLIVESFEDASNRNKSKKVKLCLEGSFLIDFYTVIPAIRLALVNIFESMIRHTKELVIYVGVDLIQEDSVCELYITDKSKVTLAQSSDSLNLKGKSRLIINESSAIFDYGIEANFANGRQCLTLTSQIGNDIQKKYEDGYVHRVRIPLPND